MNLDGIDSDELWDLHKRLRKRLAVVPGQPGHRGKSVGAVAHRKR